MLIHPCLVSVNAGGLYVKIPIKRNIYLYFIPRQLNGLDFSDAAGVANVNEWVSGISEVGGA